MGLAKTVSSFSSVQVCKKAHIIREKINKCNQCDTIIMNLQQNGARASTSSTVPSLSEKPHSHRSFWRLSQSRGQSCMVQKEMMPRCRAASRTYSNITRWSIWFKWIICVYVLNVRLVGWGAGLSGGVTLNFGTLGNWGLENWSQPRKPFIVISFL